MFKSKEKYNEYMRNYYHSHKVGRYDSIKNQLKALFDYAIKTNDYELVKKLDEFSVEFNNVILLKYRFEVPKEITDFLEESENYNFNFKDEDKN